MKWYGGTTKLLVASAVVMFASCAFAETQSNDASIAGSSVSQTSIQNNVASAVANISETQIHQASAVAATSEVASAVVAAPEVLPVTVQPKAIVVAPASSVSKSEPASVSKKEDKPQVSPSLLFGIPLLLCVLLPIKGYFDWARLKTKYGKLDTIVIRKYWLTVPIGLAFIIFSGLVLVVLFVDPEIPTSSIMILAISTLIGTALVSDYLPLMLYVPSKDIYLISKSVLSSRMAAYLPETVSFAIMFMAFVKLPIVLTLQIKCYLMSFFSSQYTEVPANEITGVSSASMTKHHFSNEGVRKFTSHWVDVFSANNGDWRFNPVTEPGSNKIVFKISQISNLET